MVEGLPMILKQLRRTMLVSNGSYPLRPHVSLVRCLLLRRGVSTIYPHNYGFQELPINRHGDIKLLSTFYPEHQEIQNEMHLRSSYDLDLEYTKGISVSHIGIWYDNYRNKASKLQSDCARQLETLCDMFAVTRPPPNIKIFTTRLNPVLTVRYEEHSEFCTFTFIKKNDPVRPSKAESKDGSRVKPKTELSFGSFRHRGMNTKEGDLDADESSVSSNSSSAVPNCEIEFRPFENHGENPAPVFVDHALDLVPTKWLHFFHDSILIATHVEVVPLQQANLYLDLDAATQMVSDNIRSIQKLFNHNSLAGAEVQLFPVIIV